MIAGVTFAAALGLLAMCIRMWMEFGQRARQLQGESAHNTRLIEEHTEKLKSVRSRIDEAKEEMESLLAERGKLESDVMAQRDQLTELEERMERTRPKSHRVDKAAGDDLFG